MTRPATRVGRYVILPGGQTIRLSHFQHALYAFGLRKKIKPNTVLGSPFRR